MSARAELVLARLRDRPAAIDELARKLSLPASEVATALAELELRPSTPTTARSSVAHIMRDLRNGLEKRGGSDGLRSRACLEHCPRLYSPGPPEHQSEASHL